MTFENDFFAQSEARNSKQMNNARKHFELYEHPADMGIRGFGSTKEQAFEHAALAMLSIITDPDTVDPIRKIEIVCNTEPNDELMLFSWLNAVLCEIGSRKMLFSKFKLMFEKDVLRATAWGESIDTNKHAFSVEVKAATMCDVNVSEQNGKWIAQCIVDL